MTDNVFTTEDMIFIAKALEFYPPEMNDGEEVFTHITLKAKFENILREIEEREGEL